MFKFEIDISNFKIMFVKLARQVVRRPGSNLCFLSTVPSPTTASSKPPAPGTEGAAKKKDKLKVGENDTDHFTKFVDLAEKAKRFSSLRSSLLYI